MRPLATKVDKGGYVSLAQTDETEKRSSGRHQSAMLVVAVGFVLLMLLYGWQLHNQSRKLADLRVELVENQDKLVELQQKINAFNLGMPSHNDTMPHFRTARSLPEAFMGTHLVGIRGRNPRLCGIDREMCDNMQMPEMGQFFVWGSDSPNTFAPIRIDVVESVDPVGTFIKVRAEGYYYIYSQVTYWSTGRRTTGHETVKFLNPGDYKVLMTSVMTQKLGHYMDNGYRRRSLDSGYHGGVFYLYENDKVGVRPVNYDIRVERFFTEKTKAFFGVYFLHL